MPEYILQDHAVLQARHRIDKAAVNLRVCPFQKEGFMPIMLAHTGEMWPAQGIVDGSFVAVVALASFLKYQTTQNMGIAVTACVCSHDLAGMSHANFCLIHLYQKLLTELCFFIVWAVLILIEPTLGYAPLRAIPAHHGESYLRRDISSYDGLRKPTRYGGLGDLSCKTSKPLCISSYRYSMI